MWRRRAGGSVSREHPRSSGVLCASPQWGPALAAALYAIVPEGPFPFLVNYSQSQNRRRASLTRIA